MGDPTGILQALGDLVVKSAAAFIDEQLNYSDGTEILQEYLLLLEPLLRQLNMTEDMDPWFSILSDWVRTTRKLCDESDRAASSCICISNRRSIARRIREQGRQAERIFKTASLLYGPLVSMFKPKPLFQPVPLESQLVGLDDKLKLLLSSLHNASSTSKWLGICAMGGAGKTLLAKKAFNDPTVDQQFPERFWLTLGRDRKVETLQEDLLMQILKKEVRVSHKQDGKTLLASSLRGRRVLLVLDDVWQPSLLNWFDVVQDDNGSRTLVTTRNQEVLDGVRAVQVPFDLLTPEQSWELFSIHAFGGVQGTTADVRLLSKVLPMAQEMTKHCKGLPLALQVVGTAMARKNEVFQWELMLQRLRKQLNNTGEEQLFGVLRASYDDLGTISDLGTVYQDCFLDLAAFPEDEEISVEELVRIWKCSTENELEAYEVGKVLESRCLVEVTMKQGMFPLDYTAKYYKVHDVLRDLALRIVSASEERLFVPGAGTTQEHFERKYHGQHSKVLQKVSLQGSSVNSLQPLDSTPSPCVNVLLLNNTKYLDSISSSLVDNFSNLQVLSLRNCGVTKWPDKLSTLKQLKVLDAFGTEYSGRIPLASISGCTSLEFLHTNYSIGSNIEFLGSFTSLTHLSIEEYFVSAPNNVLAKLVNLRTLDLNLKDVNDVTKALHSFRRMEVLRLWYKGEETSEFWTGIFQKSVHLKFLCIRNGSKDLDLQDPICLDKVPAELPELEVFYFGNGRVKSLPRTLGDTDTFPSLRELYICNCSRLTMLPDLSEGALPKLSKLRMHNCVITNLPQSWVILGSSLEKLELLECNKVDRIFPSEVGVSGFSKLVHLELPSTRISSLPQALSRLPKLRLLDVRDCRRLLTLPAMEADGFPSLLHVRVSGSGLDAQQIGESIVSSRTVTETTLVDFRAFQPHHVVVLLL